MILFFINLVGLVLIALIIWWFIIAKPKATQIKENTIEIKVHNGTYEPAVIQAQKGKPLHLRFLREDQSPCSEVVIFEKLDISAKLPLNKPHDITFTIDKPGEYNFSCQMGMYRGKLVIE